MIFVHNSRLKIHIDHYIQLNVNLLIAKCLLLIIDLYFNV